VWLKEKDTLGEQEMSHIKAFILEGRKLLEYVREETMKDKMVTTEKARSFGTFYTSLEVTEETVKRNYKSQTLHSSLVHWIAFL
jgi:ureidoglycolate hydrolase